MFTELAGLVVPVPGELPSLYLPLTVSSFVYRYVAGIACLLVVSDAKQARDLVAILAESKQQIDPRLAEMARYGGGGGGGGGRWGGRGRGRGGFTSSNTAPLGTNRRW
jgi:hypothetical protein